jgi:nuclear autoantigenic sperm protein
MSTPAAATEEPSAVTEPAAAPVTASVEAAEPAAGGDVDVNEKGDKAVTDETVPDTEKTTAATDKTVTPGRYGKAMRVPISEKCEEETVEDTEAGGDEEESGDDDMDADAEDDTDRDAPEVDKDVSQDDDVSNLQIAWEMLELAKSIYLKQETKEAKLKQAECLKKLGEVGLESEQYTQSIEDFRSCLQLFADNVDDVKTDRRLAEANYHIGVACVYANRYDDGTKHFSDAITILEAKAELLRTKIEELSASVPDSETATEGEGPLAAARSELKEIMELIPDIKLKIEDAEEEKNAVHLMDVIKAGEEGITTTGFGNEASMSSATVCETKPVDDVTHLIRKKRKPEDDEAVPEVKKPKTITSEEAAVPACTAEVAVNGTTNGHKVNGSSGEKVTNGVDVTVEVPKPANEQTEAMDVGEIKVKSVSDVVPENTEPAGADVLETA